MQELENPMYRPSYMKDTTINTAHAVAGAHMAAELALGIHIVKFPAWLGGQLTAPGTRCSSSTTGTLALRRRCNQLPLLPPSSCPNLPRCSTPILSRGTSQAIETKHQDTSATRQHPTNWPCVVLVQRTTCEMNSSCVLFDSPLKTKHHNLCVKS